MNEKGFTLIELLVTIVLIGVISAVAVTSITNINEASKVKNEDIFVGRLSEVINEYITMYHSNYDYSYYKEFTKETGQTIIKISPAITLSRLVDTGLITSPITNPRNKKNCLDDTPTFYIYKDSDYVFCFNINLSCLERTNKKITSCSFEVE